MINVAKKSDTEYNVVVREKGSQTQHTVTLDNAYYIKLTRGKITAEQLIEKSFEFLLKRESKESILSKFQLQIISRYFPEYEKTIQKS